MSHRRLLVAFCLLFLAYPALAQEIYKWKDEKDQWHFSHFPPPGVQAEKGKGGKPIPEPFPVPSTERHSPAPSLPDAESKDEAAPDTSPTEAAKASPEESSTWLLLTPPIRDNGLGNFTLLTERPLSEWRVRRTHESKEGCERVRTLLIAHFAKLRDFVNFKARFPANVTFAAYLEGRCVPSEGLKTA